MARTAGRIHSGLVILELLDVLLVNGTLSLLLLPIGVFLFRTCIPPHFAQESRDICIAHVRIFLLDTLTATLRELEKCRHGTFWSHGMFLGATFGNQTGTFVCGLGTNITNFIISRFFIPDGAILIGKTLPLVRHNIQNVIIFLQNKKETQEIRRNETLNTTF